MAEMLSLAAESRDSYAVRNVALRVSETRQLDVADLELRGAVGVRERVGPRKEVLSLPETTLQANQRLATR